MSSAVLDRIVHRSGSSRLRALVADPSTVKINLQNVSDHLVAHIGDRDCIEEPVRTAAARLGAVMWPWTSALAYWRSAGVRDTFLADYAALVWADHAGHWYEALLFRLRPHARCVEFLTWGGVQCSPEGRLAAQFTPDKPHPALIAHCVQFAHELLERPLRNEVEVRAYTSSVRVHQNSSRYLTTVLTFAARFANCRNVVQVETASASTTPKPWLRSGHPRYTYKTLAIDPGALRVRRPDSQPTGRHGVSLHICRGHFATYTVDRPLFGKYTGTFWIPQHTRGDPGVGFVEKDYAVGAPAVPVSHAAPA